LSKNSNYELVQIDDAGNSPPEVTSTFRTGANVQSAAPKWTEQVGIDVVREDPKIITSCLVSTFLQINVPAASPQYAVWMAPASAGALLHQRRAAAIARRPVDDHADCARCAKCATQIRALKLAERSRQ
jgi:hypothetical protein